MRKRSREITDASVVDNIISVKLIVLVTEAAQVHLRDVMLMLDFVLHT